MQNSVNTIAVLNDLIQINNDRIVGYEKAIMETKPEDSDLKGLFAIIVAESHNMRIALAAEVQNFGAEIEQGTTTYGKIYRAWTEVKAIFTGHNRYIILSNCDAIETATQQAYQTALQNDLPVFIRDLLTRHKEALEVTQEEVRSLKDQYV